MKLETLGNTYLEKVSIAIGIRNPGLAARAAKGTASKSGWFSKLKSFGNNAYNKADKLMTKGTNLMNAKANAANAQAAANNSQSTAGFLKNKFNKMGPGGKAAVIGGAGVAAGALLAKRKKEQGGSAPNTVIHY